MSTDPYAAARDAAAVLTPADIDVAGSVQACDGCGHRTQVTT